MSLSQEEAFARIRLLRSPNIGPVSYHQLLHRFGNAEAAIDALPELAKQGRRAYRAADAGAIETEIAAVRQAKARYVFHDSPEYPGLLGQVEGAPPILIIRGALKLASGPCVAMVGARNASAASVKLARDLADGLAKEGFTVVSGLGRGIDGAAHQGALPQTVGVIAGGIDVTYPPQHAELQEKIAQEGLLMTEQPPATQPRGSHFPTRNRIIAGLAAGTVVVEAAPRSGSLITARLAGEAGREVMAVPGSPLEARALGCNQLIREGAVLVQSVEDITELLSSFDGAPVSTFRDSTEGAFEAAAVEASTEDSAAVQALLSTTPIEVDELIRQSGQKPAHVQWALLELEVSGLLERHAGGRVSLASAQ